MKIDIVLVGPWVRVSELSKPRKDFLDYLSFIRSHDYVSKIIYSSSDVRGVIPGGLFDVVCSNNQKIQEFSSGRQQNQNTAAFIQNSLTGIENATSDYVIKVRSDLYVQDFDLIRDNLIKHPGRAIVDYHIAHSLLIPYYFPDFLFASDTRLAKNFFRGSLLTPVNKVKKRLVVSPFKSLQAGRMNSDVQYTEYSLWTFLINNYLSSSEFKVKLMSSLSFFDYIKSITFIKSNLVFINRSQLFIENDRFKFPGRINSYFFSDGVFKFNSIYFLFIYHGCLFCNRSIASLMNKAIFFLKKR